MLLELHLLQNFAPSNLNRDDTGSPKDCLFGGYTRARISSQCLKRAMRTEFKDRELIPTANLAARTKRIVDAMADALSARGRPRDQAVLAATALLNSLKLSVDPTDRMTQYLLFVSEAEIAAAVRACEEHWDALLAAAQNGQAGRRSSSTVPDEVKRAAESVLNGRRAADLALFGRMIADRPEFNVEAASQVAHAISTNRVSTEFDFYTAVDDLKPQDTAGADMLGTVEFNSACFYRYANVDIAALGRNLAGDPELTQRTVWAFMHAAVDAIPTGKQNSMAAHNPPAFVMAVVREHGAWNLANAFLQPAQPGRDGDLMRASIHQLDECWGKLTGMYGLRGLHGARIATYEPGALDQLKANIIAVGPGESQIDALARWAVATVFAPPTA